VDPCRAGLCSVIALQRSRALSCFALRVGVPPPPSESSNTTNPLNLGDDVANLLIILEDSISAGFLILEDLRNRERHNITQFLAPAHHCRWPLPCAFCVTDIRHEGGWSEHEGCQDS
jgi:hypothetical protein